MEDTISTSSEIPVVENDYNDHPEDKGELADGATNRTGGKISATPDDCRQQSAEYLLVVVGPCKTGKSSLCNLITGNKGLFPVGSGLNICTVEAKEKTVSEYGHTYCVMDTPDGEKGDMAQLANRLKKRLAGFNNKVFFLFCVRCDDRFALRENIYFKNLKFAWKSNADFDKRLLLAFTYSDTLPDDGSPIDNIKAGNGGNNGSPDAPQHDLKIVQSEEEQHARILYKMMQVKWKQLSKLVKDAQQYFIFSSKETFEANEVRRLLNYVAEYTPPPSCWQKQPCKVLSYVLTIVLLLSFVLLILTVSYFVWQVAQFLSPVSSSPVTPGYSSL